MSPGIREDRGNCWVIAAFGLIGIIAAFVPAWTDRIDLWIIDGDVLRGAGAGVPVAADAGTWLLRLFASEQFAPARLGRS